MHGTEPLDPFAIIRSAFFSTLASVWGVILAVAVGINLAMLAAHWSLPDNPLEAVSMVILVPLGILFTGIMTLLGLGLGIAGFFLVAAYFLHRERRLELLVAIALDSLLFSYVAFGKGDLHGWVRVAVCAAVILGAYGALWLACWAYGPLARRTRLWMAQRRF